MVLYTILGFAEDGHILTKEARDGEAHAVLVIEQAPRSPALQLSELFILQTAGASPQPRRGTATFVAALPSLDASSELKDGHQMARQQ